MSSDRDNQHARPDWSWWLPGGRRGSSGTSKALLCAWSFGGESLQRKTKFELVSAHAKVPCSAFSDRSPTHTFEKWCCFPSGVVLRVNKNASPKNFHIKKKSFAIIFSLLTALTLRNGTRCFLQRLLGQARTRGATRRSGSERRAEALPPPAHLSRRTNLQITCHQLWSTLFQVVSPLSIISAKRPVKIKYRPHQCLSDLVLYRTSSVIAINHFNFNLLLLMNVQLFVI